MFKTAVALLALASVANASFLEKADLDNAVPGFFLQDNGSGSGSGSGSETSTECADEAVACYDALVAPDLECSTEECFCEDTQPYYEAALACYDECDDDATVEFVAEVEAILEELEALFTCSEDPDDTDDPKVVSANTLSVTAATVAVVVGVAALN
jgi:hypothetical protein